MARFKIAADISGGVAIQLTPAEESIRDAEEAAWAAAQPAMQAEANRLSAIDTTIAGFSFGGQTLGQLKAMDNAGFDSWWSTSVTNLAQANTVLKLLARTVLRRLL